MMSVTHAAIAVCATTVALGTANPFVLLTAAIGSQLPDVDTTESFAGRIVYPVAKWLEERYPHRTITHSFAASGAVAALGLPLVMIHWHYWLGLVLGHFCGWFSDSFTKAGVAAFFPSPARLVIPGNPKVRLESKSPAEYWVLAIALCLIVVSVNLISAGGISEQFGRLLFNDASTAAQTFNKYGSQQRVWIELEGINVRTGQQVSGHFTVIATDSNNVIVEDSSGKLYKIGTASDAQVQPIKLKTFLGDRLSVLAQELVVMEMSVADWVKTLPPAAYITGSLLLDDMEDVQIPLEMQAYPVMRVVGGQVELLHAKPAQILLLREFWIVMGRAIVKVRQ